MARRSLSTRAQIQYNPDGTSINPALPSSLVIGNLLIAAIGHPNSDQSGSVAFPSGWTPLYMLSGGSYGQSLCLAYRYVDGTEGSTINITWSYSTNAHAQIFQYSGSVAFGVTAVDGRGLAGGEDTALQLASATMLGKDSLWTVISFNNNSTISGTPTGYTVNINTNGGLGELDSTPGGVGSTSGALNQPFAGSVGWLAVGIELQSTPSTAGPWASTEATDVYYGSGSPTRVGTFTTTETADTAALTGTVTIVGTFTPVEATDAFSGAGVGALVGTFTPTDPTDTWAETTILGGSYGTWASTETPDVFDPADGGWSGTTGYGFGGVVGDFIVTEATDTISVDMVITISAAWASNEATDSFNAFGYLTITGTWASTEATDYMVMSVHVSGESGPWASQEPVDKFAATGNVPVVGTFTPTEPKDVLTVVVFGAPVPPKRRIFFTC